jgi:hypothetical protein
MTRGATDTKLHRSIVEVLVAEFERGVPPVSIPGVSRDVLACTWGFYAQIHRLGRSMLLLDDNGMGHETHILVRVALEHTILLHWLVERGEAGAKAILASQSGNVARHINVAQEAKMFLTPEIEQGMLDAAKKVPNEEKAVGHFKDVCKQLGLLELYFVYGVESGFVHPSLVTVNSYLDNSGNPTKEPQRIIHRSNMALLAYCLIWANRDLDKLMPGHPRADELERLAKSVEAVPMLPPYRVVPPQAPTNKKKRGRGGRRR